MSTRRIAHQHSSLSVFELSLVVTVIGIAAAVAVPEYFHLRQDANDDSAKSRLTQSAKTLERRHAAAGTFAGASLPSGIRLHARGNSFCVETSAGSHVWHVAGQAKPASGGCP